MKFDLSKIEFSRNDVRRKIKIPSGLSSELAEFVGIMVGDGHISGRARNDRHSEKVYDLQIHGNIKDREYYEKYVNDIIFSQFNIKFSVHFRPSANALFLLKSSKAIHSFIKSCFEIPSKKTNIKIPEIIMRSSKKEKAAFLRGFFDTDGCFVVKYKPNSYPVVQAASKSQQLIEEISIILADLGINSCMIKETFFYKKRNKTYSKHCIFINGRERVKKYMNVIGFSNKNKSDKYMRFLKNEC